MCVFAVASRRSGVVSPQPQHEECLRGKWFCCNHTSHPHLSGARSLCNQRLRDNREVLMMEEQSQLQIPNKLDLQGMRLNYRYRFQCLTGKKSLLELQIDFPRQFMNISQPLLAQARFRKSTCSALEVEVSRPWQQHLLSMFAFRGSLRSIDWEDASHLASPLVCGHRSGPPKVI